MSATDEIAKLNELKDSGAITEEEFAEAKIELLKQIAVKEVPASQIVELEDENMWGMFIHISQFAGYILPFLGYVLPIVLWQMKKDKSQVVDMHGKNVTNWIISAMIYGIVSGILCIVVIGIPMLFALGILCIVFPIMGAIKANNGIVWQYPITIKFFK